MKTKGIYFFYRSFQAFALPLVLFYFGWRGLRNRAYWKSIPERLGFLPRSLRQTGPGAIWLHAVSVGELLASMELLKRLRREFPNTNVYVSTSTVAGRALASDKLVGLCRGSFYAPLDTAWAVRRVLRALQPSLLLIAETEIWPNLTREAKRTNAAVAIVNGRISDRAYPRYRRFAWAFQQVLPQLDCILAQNETMQSRFVALGAPQDRVQVAGNLKYDFEPRPADPDSPVRSLIARLRPAKIWIAASTMPPAFPSDVDEDDAVIESFRQLHQRHPGLLLILAPRKPERFDQTARKLEAAGIEYVRRSKPGNQSAAALLLDSIGELSGLFTLADVVFMGGTLTNRGGHNILEPALFGKPVIAGPNMQNFQAIADEFRLAGAYLEIRSPLELTDAVDRLLADSELATRIGERAQIAARSQRGATDQCLTLARQLYDRTVPEYRPAQPWFSVAGVLRKFWQWETRRRQAVARTRSLPVPVISVGNLTMGGTGKTPCVLRLAGDLQAAGASPGILMRGYRRSSSEKQIILAAGASATPDRTGDEAQLYLRSGIAPVGIGRDRYAAGLGLHHKFGCDLLLLDDGFQHVSLARQLDLVLIDALNPFGGGHVFPLGRLREPLSALSRADMFLITRSDLSDTAQAIANVLRRWHPGAPVFYARLEPQAWVELRSGVRHPLAPPPFGKVAAFCGLGNPASLRRTLESMGIDLGTWIEFPDHHRYTLRDLENIRAQAADASAIVTTAKDAVKLDEGSTCPRLYYLDVALAIDRPRAFLNEILNRLNRNET